MMRVGLLVTLVTAVKGQGTTACAYRCDPSWPGLDKGVCYNGECPSPDSQYVADTLCSGLPYTPGPGDILLHDQVPFTSSDVCQQYVNSWESQSKLSNSSGLMVKGNDVTDFTSRGKMWFSVVSFLIQDCGSLDECQDLIHGATGKQVQICIDKCAFEFGEQKLETALCDLVGGSSTAGLAVFFCHTLFPKIMQPVNKILNKYIEDPIIHAVESIQDAATNFAQKMGSFFGKMASCNLLGACGVKRRFFPKKTSQKSLACWLATAIGGIFD